MKKGGLVLEGCLPRWGWRCGAGWAPACTLAVGAQKVAWMGDLSCSAMAEREMPTTALLVPHPIPLCVIRGAV